MWLWGGHGDGYEGMFCVCLYGFAHKCGCRGGYSCVSVGVGRCVSKKVAGIRSPWWPMVLMTAGKC